MSDSTGERLWELFDQAVELPKDQQSAFLDRQCADDRDLRARVERLLAGDEKANQVKDANSFLKSPIERMATTAMGSNSGMLRLHAQTASPLPGYIGQYQILSLLGEGGMGTVYQAQQNNPRRIVALKVVRRGLVSKALTRRVAHEAQILGRLQHTGIAQIYEAGLAEDDLPYFAMEFIRGLPLGDYVKHNGSSTKECLRLMAEICEAIHYAHEQGIIHRDLKPTNILVDEEGQPKILDFGIARAIDAETPGSGAVTQSGQLIGTLNYMSPEQIQGVRDGLDRRSDVYSLGVVLYEMLTGHMPYDIHDLPLPEMARVICEVEARPMSAAHPHLRGDVETIVSKSLQKDRDARYPSASALAGDIRRYLDNQPILARPPSALYLLMKFTRRHTAAVLGAIGIVMALVGGLAGTTLFAVRAQQNAKLANEGMATAIFQTYRARMAAAAAALTNHDVDEARRQLAAAPEQHRDWEWQHFCSRLDDSAATLIMPTGAQVLSLNDESQLCTASTKSGVTEFRNEAGEVLSVWPVVDGSSVYQVGSSSAGIWRAAITNDRQLVLRARDDTLLTSIKLPEKTSPTCMAVSSDRQWLAIAWDGPGALGAFDLIEIASGRRAARCQAHTDVIRRLAFSPNNQSIASAAEDSTVRTWNVSDGKELHVFQGHAVKVHCVNWRADGERLVTASADGTVRQWSADGQAVEPEYDRHAGEVLFACFSPDGHLIASAGTDRSIRVWSAVGRRDVALLHGHTREVKSLCFANDSYKLLSIGDDDRVRLWETALDESLPKLVGHDSYVYPVAISPDGQWMASGSWDRTVRLWDAWTGEYLATYQHPERVLSLAFSSDSSWLVTSCGDDDRLRVWKLGTRQPCRELAGPGRTINYVGINKDDSKIVAIDMSGRCQFIDVASGQAETHDRMSTIAFSPDRTLLATNAGKDSKEIVIRDAQTLKVQKILAGHSTSTHSVAFSQDNQHLVSVGHDQSIYVWDIDSGLFHALPGTTGQVFAAIYHPNGHRIATAGRDGSIMLWDTQTYEEVGRLTGHSNYIWSLAFSPDGHTLVSGSGDSTLRLWDTYPIAERHRARREASARRAAARSWLSETNIPPEELFEYVRTKSSLTWAEGHAVIRELIMNRTATQ